MKAELDKMKAENDTLKKENHQLKTKIVANQSIVSSSSRYFSFKKSKNIFLIFAEMKLQNQATKVGFSILV